MGRGPLPTQAVVGVVASYFVVEPSSSSTSFSYGPMPMCVMPRGELAYWTEEQGVCMWDGHQVKSFKESLARRDWRASALAPFPHGCKLAIGLESGHVMWWDVDAGSGNYLRRVASARVGSVTGLVVLSNESSRPIVVAGTSQHEFRAWDVDLDVCVWNWSSFSTKSSIFDMITLPHGAFVSGDSEGGVCMRDSDGSRARSFDGHRRVVRVLVSLRGGKLATGSMDKTVRIWNTKDQACLQCLEGHTAEVLSLAELPMDRLASGSYDRTVRVWQVTTGDCLLTLVHNDPIFAVVALPGGQVAAAAGFDVHVWNANDGVILHVLKRHSRLVTKLALLHNGQLVSVDTGRTMHTWV